MKVLISASQIYNKDIPKLAALKTGMAVVIGNLVESMQREISVDAISYDKPNKGIKSGNVVIYNNSPTNIFRFFRFKYLKVFADKLINKYGIKDSLKEFYYLIEADMIESCIKDHGVDIINLHGATSFNMNLISKSIKHGIPCVLTLHIYINNDYKESDFSGYTKVLDNQKKVFKTVIENKIPIIVVSSGMKRRILNDYPEMNSDNIYVIPNGQPLYLYNKVYTEQATEPKNDGKFVYLCAGTIGERKNQIQILRALRILPPEEKENIKVIFCGNDSTGSFAKTINEFGLDGVAIYLGSVPYNNMPELYDKCDAVISTSLNEAFGLTFIEGFAYGKPAVFFYDIDAVDELYETNVACTIKSHDDSAVASSLLECKKIKWDTQAIKKQVRLFDITQIAKRYLDLFKIIRDSCKRNDRNS